MLSQMHKGNLCIASTLIRMLSGRKASTLDEAVAVDLMRAIDEAGHERACMHGKERLRSYAGLNGLLASNGIDVCSV